MANPTGRDFTYANVDRKPAIGDIVRVPGEVGEWLVDEIGPYGDDVGLRGEPGSFIWGRVRFVDFVRASSHEDRLPYIINGREN